MKKIFVVLLALLLCLTAVACSKEKPSDDKKTETNTPAKESHWSSEYYTDDFGDSTSKSYIRGVFEGTFSNSATSGSDLTACLFLDRNLTGATGDLDMFRIRLLEYGHSKVSFTGCDYMDVDIKVKINGVVTEETADYLFEDRGEIVVTKWNDVYEAVINALNANQDIAFVITVGEYGTSTYRFDVDTYGLSSISHSWSV